jgi:hypothetical protein
MQYMYHIHFITQIGRCLTIGGIFAPKFTLFYLTEVTCSNFVENTTFHVYFPFLVVWSYHSIKKQENTLVLGFFGWTIGLV